MTNFEDDKRLLHYFERIYFQANRSLNSEYCINVVNKLTDLFPRVGFFFLILQRTHIFSYLFTKRLSNTLKIVQHKDRLDPRPQKKSKKSHLA